jgi:histidinol-phosphatase
LIALVENGEPVVGIASAPALGERYQAVRGEGATLNGKPIHVSREGSLVGATLCSSGLYAFLGTPWERAYIELARRVARNRSFGDFWGHMLVARGSVEAMVESRLRIWDWAALKVIVEEAGGRMTQIDGSEVGDGGASSRRTERCTQS